MTSEWHQIDQEPPPQAMTIPPDPPPSGRHCASSDPTHALDHRVVNEMADALRKLADTAAWMSGSADFGPGGRAHEAWEATHRQVLLDALYVLAGERWHREAFG